MEVSPFFLHFVKNGFIGKYINTYKIVGEFIPNNEIK